MHALEPRSQSCVQTDACMAHQKMPPAQAVIHHVYVQSQVHMHIYMGKRTDMGKMMWRLFIPCGEYIALGMEHCPLWDEFSLKPVAGSQDAHSDARSASQSSHVNTCECCDCTGCLHHVQGVRLVFWIGWGGMQEVTYRHTLPRVEGLSVTSTEPDIFTPPQPRSRTVRHDSHLHSSYMNPYMGLDCLWAKTFSQ